MKLIIDTNKKTLQLVDEVPASEFLKEISNLGLTLEGYTLIPTDMFIFSPKEEDFTSDYNDSITATKFKVTCQFAQ